MPRNQDWADDGVDPLRGPNSPVAFLKSNFKLSAPGSVFRTVKARFRPNLIHAEAAKADVQVRIDDEDPWLKVTIISKELR